MLFEKWKARLDNESINDTMMTINSRLYQYCVEKHEKIRISLMLEDALLTYRDDAENYKEFEIILLHNNRNAVIYLHVIGLEKNPLLDDENEDEFITRHLSSLSAEMNEPVRYSYRLGRNTLIYRANREKRRFYRPDGTC